MSISLSFSNGCKNFTGLYDLLPSFHFDIAFEHFNRLTKDVQFLILRHLPWIDLVLCQRVSQSWLGLIRNPLCWRGFCLECIDERAIPLVIQASYTLPFIHGFKCDIRFKDGNDAKKISNFLSLRGNDIQVLYLDSTSYPSLAPFTPFTSLTKLTLQNMNLKDHHRSALSTALNRNCATLLHVDLRYNYLSDITWKEISWSKLEKVKHLFLGSNITDATVDVLPYFQYMSHLHEFEAGSDTNMFDAEHRDWNHLRLCPTLQQIKVRFRTYQTENLFFWTGFVQAISMSKHLKFIVVDGVACPRDIKLRMVEALQSHLLDHLNHLRINLE